MDTTNQINQNRRFMHCPSFFEGMKESDQAKGVPAPPFGQILVNEAIKLPSFEGITTATYVDLLDARRSKRNYTNTPMTQEQLAFMLWSTQGIQHTRKDIATFRPVPSGGARHPFETYIAVKNVEELSPGLYHYLPSVNIGEKLVTIEYLTGIEDYDNVITSALAGQSWAANAPIIIFTTCVPYKAEWRYHEMSHRVMLIDLGHLGQNAMLSAVALGLGSCCMAAYNQAECDNLLGIKDLDEYTVYAVSVGTPTE